MSTDRPATADQEPKVYGATPDRPGYTAVMTDAIVKSRIHGRSPWATVEAIGDALDRAGYTVAARASQGHQEPVSVPRGPGAAQGATDGSGAESEPRYIVETNHCGQWLHGLEFDDLTEARDYAEYCRATYGGTRIVRVTREVIQ